MFYELMFYEPKLKQNGMADNLLKTLTGFWSEKNK